MQVNIETSWKEVLADEFEKPYFKELISFVKHEYAHHTCYPRGSQIFAAFDHCPFDKVKVVIIGQDPYHGLGQAHGLCFSVNEGVPMPPSLVNIFSEIQEDLGKPFPPNGSLVRWADQGVLLLNAVLTVRKGEANSHQGKGWETFTDAVIQKISNQKEDVVFLLWGKYAQQKQELIDETKHLVLKAAHPSPFSAYSGFFGCRHFSKTNEHLVKNGIDPIDWSIG